MARPSAPVHLCGSVPLEDAKTVLTQAAQRLGTAVARIPDGETESGEAHGGVAHE